MSRWGGRFLFYALLGSCDSQGSLRIKPKKAGCRCATSRLSVESVGLGLLCLGGGATGGACELNGADNCVLGVHQLKTLEVEVAYGE